MLALKNKRFYCNYKGFDFLNISKTAGFETFEKLAGNQRNDMKQEKYFLIKLKRKLE